MTAALVRMMALLFQAAVLALEGGKSDGLTKCAKRGETSPTLPLFHPRLKDTGREVQQVHITATDAVIVNFVTLEFQESRVEFRPVSCGEADPLGRSQSSEFCSSQKAEETAWRTAEGSAHQYSSLNFYTPMDAEGRPIFDKARWGKWDEPADWYTSGFCHAVPLTHLEPGALYSYRVPPMADSIYFFRAPKAAGSDAATRIGVIGDVGQTNVSLQTLDRVRDHLLSPASLDQVLLLGDLSYADGFGPRWDSFGRLSEPLLSHVPAAVVGGNHEFAQGEAWVPLRARWPMPGGGGGGANPLYYSYEAGPVHVLALCSYMDSQPHSPMHTFVERDLKGVDRSRTPWVVVMMHAPWYTSNSNHPMASAESTVTRDNLEPLLLAAGVDLVLSGHVHAYERTFPMARGERMEACKGGIVHVTIGDGGNREGLALPWLEPQPAWSALREASYGFGVLDVQSATEAEWEWWRDDGGTWDVAERVLLKRGKCEEEEGREGGGEGDVVV